MRLVDVSKLFARDDILKSWRDEKALERGPGTIVLVFNPEGLSLTLPLLGATRTLGKRMVGYWAWELPRIPDSWIDALNISTKSGCRANS